MSKPPHNFWHVLGLDPSATDEQIRSAHRRMAGCWHPDVNKSPQAEEKFKLVQTAYETLSDPTTRVEHTYALARIAAADVPDDDVDAALAYGKPKKKKKKKKKVKTDEIPAYVQHPPPPIVRPPSWYYEQRQGQADYAPIPEGFETYLRDVLPGSNGF